MHDDHSILLILEIFNRFILFYVQKLSQFAHLLGDKKYLFDFIVVFRLLILCLLDFETDFDSVIKVLRFLGSILILTFENLDCVAE